MKCIHILICHDIYGFYTIHLYLGILESPLTTQKQEETRKHDKTNQQTENTKQNAKKPNQH